MTDRLKGPVFIVDSDILAAVAVGFFHFVLKDKEADCVAESRKAGDEKYGGGDKGKNVAEDKDEQAYADEEQAHNKAAFGQAFGHIRERVALNEKSKHLNSYISINL
jgi:hypothetical protein